MGRTVFIEHYVEEIFAASPYSSFGLLLGQSFENKEYVTLACRCPPNESAGSSPDQQKVLDRMWIENHCRNLLRMLPGGLTVCGLFWVAKHESLKGREQDLTQILSALYRCEKASASDHVELCEPQKVLLVVDPNSKKLLAKSSRADETPGMMELRPAEIKFGSFLDRWHIARSTVDLNLSLALPANQTQSCFSRRLLGALTPFMAHIVSAEGRLAGGGDLNSPINARDEVEVVLYHCPDPQSLIEEAENAADVPTADLEDSFSSSGGSHCVRVSGKIPAVALLHAKATGKTAVQALKSDIVRSLSGRIALLLEELEVTDEVEDFHVEQTLLPQRVLVRLPRLSPRLLLSDYKFHSETREDVLSRVLYFCGLDVFRSGGKARGDIAEEDNSEASSTAEEIGLELDLDLEQCCPPSVSESDVETIGSEDERLVESVTFIDRKWLIMGVIFIAIAAYMTTYLLINR